MIDGTIVLGTGAQARRVALASYLDAAAEEAARDAEYAWIKNLRHATVDGTTFRQRFTVRGDSLWWFSEIYLHKQRVILDAFRAMSAAERLIERERPSLLSIEHASAVVRHVVTAVAAQRAVTVTDGAVPSAEWRARLRRLHWRARLLTFTAFASRFRPRRAPRVTPPRIAAFVHKAFWRAGTDDGSAESYIGPVLRAIEEKAGRGAIRYVGIGPSANFRARRWWDPIAAPASTDSVVPVERYAPWKALAASRAVWRARQQHFRLLTASDALRRAAAIGGIDCWPVVREALAGIAWLQWPWSVRAMDEAAAALDALTPGVVLTYAEAGGWGRALILEARRRGIPSVGLQHGFIYPRWLNYLHEPDELGQAGFPLPTLTLAFDAYAARHLRDRGHFPPEAVQVTGSPRLDLLMASLATLAPDEVAAARHAAGVKDDETLVLLTTKEREARQVLPAIVRAAGALPKTVLVVKPHPAETAAAYDSIAADACVRIVPASAPLAPLMAASRAVVTVNSTLALDAAVAGIPALVTGLPNNLSPFVAAGVLAGAEREAAIPVQLERILYDEGFRQQLAGARGAFLRDQAMGSDGRAAARSADAILKLVRQS